MAITEIIGGQEHFHNQYWRQLEIIKMNKFPS